MGTSPTDHLDAPAVRGTGPAAAPGETPAGPDTRGAIRSFRVVAVLTSLLFLATQVFGLLELALMWLPTETLVELLGEEGGSAAELSAHRSHYFAIGILAWAVVPAVLTQVRRPARRQAQMVWLVVAAAVGAVVYGLSGTVGAWLVEEGVVLVPVLALALLHPRSRQLFQRPGRDRAMLGLTVLATVPWFGFAMAQARLQWQNAAGDLHAEPEHWATVALMATIVVAAAVIGSSDRPGWQHPAWFAVGASIAWGAHSLLFPDGASASPTAWAGLSIAWGLAFAVTVVARGRAAAEVRP